MDSNAQISQHGPFALFSPSKTFHVRNILKQPPHLIQKGKKDDNIFDDKISSLLYHCQPENVLYSQEPVFPSANTISLHKEN